MPNPTDPLFANQWHLLNSGAGLYDLNVAGVWEDYTGAGVRVAVIDDGFDYNHDDLDDNYNDAIDYDYEGFDDDPFGSSSEAHGTATSGIIGAEANNGIGGAGVAYGVELLGYRVDGFITNSFVIDLWNAIDDAATGDTPSDIVNMSLGTNYIGNYFDTALGFMDTLNGNIDDAAANGRGNLGLIMVKSAGNERGIAHDANASSWNANRHTISVAAVDQDGFVSSYSTHGANVLISGFGTPGEVVTTDREGSAGYDSGDYVSDFNGTSAAAPMVSGVVALMLEANPNLGWRDVQEILAYSARHVGSDIGDGLSGSEEYAWVWNGANNWNGGGLHFSNDYGFGLVDALAAVRLAETWSMQQTSANEGMAVETIIDTYETIDGTANGGDTAGTSGTETYGWTETTDILIETVTLEIYFSHSYVGDIDITLISPSGTTISVIDNVFSSSSFFGDWTFTISGFWGESSAGDWQVILEDSFSGDEFRVRDLEFIAYGNTNIIDDLYIYTEEFSEFVSSSSHPDTLSDSDGGIDTINTAAIGSNTILNLRAGGTSTIDGQTVMTNGDAIENAVTGDGDDRVTGNNLDNDLRGMRGDDRLVGLGGDDTLEGGSGIDTLSGGNGADDLDGGADVDTLFGQGDSDILNGGAGNDTLWGGVGDDEIFGGEDDDQISGQGNADIINGEGGDDNLLGGAGNDTIDGGDGNDTLSGNGNNDLLRGGANDDSLLGGPGSDTLEGGSGNDTLTSGPGGDRLDGGTGNDRLSGTLDGARDTFVFADGYESDRVNSYEQGTDRLELDDALWIGTHGALTTQQVVGTFGSANGTNTIVTFDFGNGDILELQNGSGLVLGTLGADLIIV